MASIPPELASTVAAIIDGGSLEAAAQALSITPSAVSQRLKTLEQQVGRVLVVRGRPAVATPSGEAVVRLARQIALLEHEATAELGLGGAEDLADRRVSLVAVPAPVHDGLDCALRLRSWRQR